MNEVPVDDYDDDAEPTLVTRSPWYRCVYVWLATYRVRRKWRRLIRETIRRETMNREARLARR